MSRDFTFIDDIVDGVGKATALTPTGDTPYRVYNIGNSHPVSLLQFISVIENVTGHKAVMHMEGMQPGDMQCTYADISRIGRECGYSPKTSVEEGIARFYDWYRNFYGNR